MYHYARPTDAYEIEPQEDLTSKMQLHFENAYEKEFTVLYQFIKKKSTRYFGVPKLKQREAKSFFSHNIIHRLKVQLGSQQHSPVVGIGEFMTHLPISAVPTDCWMDWMNMHYCVPYPLTLCNVLFLNHLSYTEEHNERVFKATLAEIFLREDRLRYIVAIEMPRIETKGVIPSVDYSLLRKYSTVFYPRIFSTKCHNTQKIHVLHRDDYLRKMHYRKAVPEDNDDIVEICDFEHPQMRQELGDFYIAEELLNEATKKFVTIICIEVENVISGFIWLNSNVDIELMVRNFEVELFGNLIKFNSNLPTKTLEFKCHTSYRRQIARIFEIAPVERLYSMNLETVSDTELTIADWRPQVKEEAAADVDAYAMPCCCVLPEMPEMPEVKAEVEEESQDGLSDEMIERLNKRFSEMKKVFKIFERYARTIRSKRHFVDMSENTVQLVYNVSEENQEIEFNSNVFSIQLFGLSPTFDVRRAFRILLSSFCVFSDRDYCLIAISPKITLPKTAHEVLKYFIPLGPRPDCQIAEHLYITHRSVINGDIIVKPVTFEDIAAVELCLIPLLNRGGKVKNESAYALTDAQPEIETIREILMDVLMNNESSFKFFTVRCGNFTKPETLNKVVGFVILREFPFAYFLKRHFRLRLNEDLQSQKMEILALRLHPLYHCLSDDLFRAMALAVDSWQFFYIGAMKKRLTNDLLHCMQPVEPKRIKRAWFMTYTNKFDWNASGNVPTLEQVNLLQDKLSVFTNSILQSRPFVIRTRLVILGLSDTCKALLRLLIFFWDSHDSRNAKLYTCLPRLEVTVICQPGVIECEYDSDFECQDCVDSKLCWMNTTNSSAFIRDATNRLDLRVYVHFVSGAVEHINRAKQYVKLKDSCIFYYDKLLLLNYIKYGMPYHLQIPELPYNYHELNTRSSRVSLYQRLLVLLKSNLKYANVIVYGRHLSTYDCVDFLLKHRVPASWIKLVVPYVAIDVANELKYNIPHMDTPTEYILQDMVADMGIEVYENYNLVSYDRYPRENLVAIVHFEHYSNKKKLSLETDVFINFNEASIRKATTKYLEESGINLSGENIIVNENYQTNDEHIYAIGRFIKFKKPPNHQYMYVSPREEAEKLIRILELNPLCKAKEFDEKFSQPNFFHCLLPKGYQFIKATIPKRYLRNHLDNEYSRKMTTNKNGFCRVRLNSYGVVEEITAVTNKPGNYDFLQYFCGRHESLLNDLRSNFCYHRIPCLLEYFQQPWCELLMHESYYYEIEKRNKRQILKHLNKSFDLLKDREQQERELAKAVPEAILEQHVLAFLRSHRNDFDYPFALPEDFPQRIFYSDS